MLEIKYYVLYLILAGQILFFLSIVLQHFQKYVYNVYSISSAQMKN